MAKRLFEMRNIPKGGVTNKGRQPKTTSRSDKTRQKIDPKLKELLEVCKSGSKDQLVSLLKDNDVINLKIKGTTPLHEACCHGNLECVKTLMQEGACPTIWDLRGYTPAHSAVHSNNLSCVRVLLDFIPPSVMNLAKATSNDPSRDGETLLHVSCMRGFLRMAQFLLTKEADCDATDRYGNSALHYAASSDNGMLVKWLIEQTEDWEAKINATNKFGQTPCHRACILGNAHSLSVLRHYNADLGLQDNNGFTSVDIARLLGNNECYQIGCGLKEPHPLPSSPSSYRGSISKSMDSLPSSQSMSASGRSFLPQRSVSNDSAPSPPTLRRRPSMTGSDRPRNLSIVRGSERGSMASIDDNSVYVTKKTALRVKSSLTHKKSHSWDNTQLLVYNSTAYEPPLDVQFVLPVARPTISRKTIQYYNNAHDITIKVSNSFWPHLPTSDPNKLDPDHAHMTSDPSLELCVCASMHLNQSFPSDYTIVSPLFFISCKTVKRCPVQITLPHAVEFSSDQDKRRLRIVSTTTVSPSVQPEFWSPSERAFTELKTDSLIIDARKVKFSTDLLHPSLYAVAVNERDFPLEPRLPLRCTLFVTYPVLEPTVSVSGLYVTTYAGMDLKTVHSAVTNQTVENKSKFEEKHFILSGSSVTVDAGLTNQSNEWVMTSKDSGEFPYNQLALTHETYRDSYSHTPYPPHTRFFVEPRSVAAAVKCRVRVLGHDGTQLCYIQVVPFSPSRELTPPPPPSSLQSTTPHFTLAHTNNNETTV